MAISKRLRFEIFRRDNHACRYCGATAPEAKLTVDHVTPTALGGGDEPANLVTACSDCNSGKSATPPSAPIVADVAADALRWSAAIKAAAEIAKADNAAAVKYRNAFKRRWDSHNWGENGQYTNMLTTSWRASVESFRQAGLPIEELKEAVDIACNNGYLKMEKVFNYMCGIAWNKVTKINKLAAELIESEAR